MQRITRYKLLFGQIAHFTPPDHPEYNSIKMALACAEEVAKDVNFASRIQESREKITAIQRDVDLSGNGEFVRAFFIFIIFDLHYT
jgi:hypothetical protein